MYERQTERNGACVHIHKRKMIKENTMLKKKENSVKDAALNIALNFTSVTLWVSFTLWHSLAMMCYKRPS